jgi:CheY-like chemotaxis protein
MKSENAKPTTVLVVEDEPTVRALAESIIEALGYMILSAANAREAIARGSSRCPRLVNMRVPCAGDQGRAGGDLEWLGRDR